MLTRARQRAVREGTSEHVDVLVGDARSLPARNHTVDIAFMEGTLELFSEAEMSGLVRELERVLPALKRVLPEDARNGVAPMEWAGAENDLS